MALTNVRQIAAWSGQRAKVQPIIGGKMELFDGWVKGNILAYEIGKRLSFTWKPDGMGKRKTSIYRNVFFQVNKNRDETHLETLRFSE